MSTNVCFHGSGAVVEMARGVWRGRPILVNKMIARCLNGQRTCQLTFVFLGRVQSFGAFGVAGQFVSTNTGCPRVVSCLVVSRFSIVFFAGSCRVIFVFRVMLSCRVVSCFSSGRNLDIVSCLHFFRVASCRVFVSCRVFRVVLCPVSFLSRGLFYGTKKQTKKLY